MASTKKHKQRVLQVRKTPLKQSQKVARQIREQN